MPNNHQMIWWLGLEADFANANLLSIIVKQPLLGWIGEPDKPLGPPDCLGQGPNRRMADTECPPSLSSLSGAEPV